MKLLLLDFEATDKVPDKARPLEFCFRAWDLATGEKRTSQGYLWDDGYGPIPEEATLINRIDEALARTGGHPKAMCENFAASVSHFDFVVAHNANGYDIPLLKAEAARWGVTLPPFKVFDTMTDIPYPERIRCRVQSHLALELGMIVDPSKLHGAVGDVDVLEYLVQKYILQFPELARISQAPVLVLKADVKYAQRELAKGQSYRWDGSQWLKRIKDFELETEREKARVAGFRTILLETN
jgi:DNA polymerase III epsilon subunit-like protein